VVPSRIESWLPAKNFMRRNALYTTGMSVKESDRFCSSLGSFNDGAGSKALWLSKACYFERVLIFSGDSVFGDGYGN
jgi:hypothetical protein